MGALRGYLYQIWHTTHAWLELKDDERLFLECAEDFDIVGINQATAVQVKASRRAITLNSTEVIKAINDFWKLLQDNPNRSIYFRFLTQATPGVEKDSPFGRGVKGLDLWRRCAREPSLVERLHTFLRDLRGLSPDLSEFLASADVGSVLASLILRIIWETHCADLGYVERAIKSRLIGYLDKEGLPPSRADRIVNRLLKETLKMACLPEARYLDRARFLEVWEEETTERVPIAQLQRLMGSVGTASIGISELTGAGPYLSFEPARMAESILPPLPGDLAPREDLVTKVEQEVERRGVMILTGSAGMGKTTLANLVAHKSGQRWLWFRLSSRAPLEASALLTRIIVGLGEDRSVTRIVLDDLDLSPGSARAYEDVLGGLVYTLGARNGQILITSQRPAPGRLLRRLALDPQAVLPIPSLAEADIAMFAARLGCARDMAALWGRVIGIQTRGHPQLVHARLKHLADAGWPSLKLEELLHTPPEVLREQADARQVLVNQLSEDHRALVYRLSVIGGPFRRDHAIRLGEEEPRLPHPGEVLDHLVGPWVEELHAGYYRLSALADKAAEHVWSSEKVHSLHIAVANAMLKSRPLTTLEARGILLHALVARSAAHLVTVTVGILKATGEVWKALSEDLSWLTLVARRAPQRVFPGDPFVNFMLRMLQFKIAAEKEPSQAAQIAELWDKEIKPRELQVPFAMERFMFASKVLVNYRVDLPARRALSLLVELAERKEQLRKLGKEVLTLPAPPAGRWASGCFDTLSDLFMFVIARCSGPGFLEDLLAGLAELPHYTRQRILRGLKDAEVNARLLVDRAWLLEADREQPQWKACIRVFGKTMERAQSWKSPELLVAAARGMAIVCEEYLRKPEQAMTVLDRATDVLGHRVGILEDQRATIMLHQGKHSEALSIWESVLPTWVPPREAFDLQPVFACRGAAISAAHLGRWQRAAEFLEEGGRRAGEVGQRGMKAAFECDVGFALWKGKVLKEAIQAWTIALHLLEDLSAEGKEARLHGVGKLVGHTLLWVANALGGKPNNGLAVPTAGFCSDPDRGEKASQMPPTPIEIAWLNLVEIEYHLHTGSQVFEEAKRRLLMDPLPLVSSFLAEFDIRHSLRRVEVEDCVEMGVSFVNALRINAAHRAQGKGIADRTSTVAPPTGSSPSDVELVKTVLLAALVALVSSERGVGVPLKIWREQASKVEGGSVLVGWLEQAEEILSGPLGNAVVAMKDRESIRDVRLMCALRGAADSEVMPGDLFYAHVMLLTFLDMLHWLDAVADGFCMLVARQWLRATETQATLRSPRLTVPGIRAACSIKTGGVPRAAKILLEASVAVDIGLPNDISVRLRELVAGAADS